MWHSIISICMFLGYGYCSYKIGEEGGKSKGWIKGWYACKEAWDEWDEITKNDKSI